MVSVIARPVVSPPKAKLAWTNRPSHFGAFQGGPFHLELRSRNRPSFGREAKFGLVQLDIRHFNKEVMGKKKSKPLSQAEIWDDSALLQSWDDALTEYQVLDFNHISPTC